MFCFCLHTLFGFIPGVTFLTFVVFPGQTSIWLLMPEKVCGLVLQASENLCKQKLAGVPGPCREVRRILGKVRGGCDNLWSGSLMAPGTSCLVTGKGRACLAGNWSCPALEAWWRMYRACGIHRFSYHPETLSPRRVRPQNKFVS